jgi:hypothetical protein
MSTLVIHPPEPSESRPSSAVAVVSEQDAMVAWRVARIVVEAAVRSLSAVDHALTRAPAPHAVITMMIGAGAVACEMTGRVAGRLTTAGRRIGGGMPRLPLVGERLDPMRALSRLAERGRRERAAAAVDLEHLAAALVPAITGAVLDHLDLTELVRERVGLDALVAEVDVDAVAARVDVDAIAGRVGVDGIAARVDVDAIAGRVNLDAIVDRLDLVALANRVIDGIDLPEIIRESTGSVTGDMVRGVRMRGIEADEVVAGLAARLLRRRPRPPAVDTAVPGVGTPA